MSLPEPVVPLVETCSTIFNNTLYTYSASAFQSLPIIKGAKWSKLSMGVPVSGGVCVQATPPDTSTPAALYIVGGRSNSTTDNYPGLQRYSFADGIWETITPTTTVTQNRLYHNAVYLNESASILVYAGNQEGSMVQSSQTFTISTTPPYNVLAYESIAPPAVAPLLIQWSENEAVMIGGSATNKQVMIFSPDQGWVDSGSSLAEPLNKNITAVKGIIQDGDDGSKHLYTFDMSVSPNAVNRTVLVDANGKFVTEAKPVVSRSLNDRDSFANSMESATHLDRRGNLTLNNWPTYNDTLAPKATRSEYSMAHDQNGLVIMSGGNDEDLLCMFKATDNCWQNATTALAARSVQNKLGGISPLHTTASTSATPSASSTTPSQTATSAAADPSAAGKAETLKVLEAVLGSVAGVALLLLVILLLLRWRRNRKRYLEAGHQRRASGLEEEKNPMDFQDRGLPFSDHMNGFQAHRQQDSQGSFSSMAILMGRVGNGHKRGMLGRGNGSNGSDASSTFNKKYKTAISNPIPHSAPAPFTGMSRDEKEVSFAPAPPTTAAPTAAASLSTPKPRVSAAARRGSTRRSSGWNRYWSGGSAMNILGFGSRRTTGYSDQSDRSSSSQYSETGTRTQVSQPSAIVPPLNLGGPPRISRVASNSPTIAAHNNSTFPLKEGIAGKIERPGSAVSDASSYDDRRDAFSSGVPESVRDEAWTPFGAHGWESGIPSVAYSESNYGTSNLPRNTITNYNSQHGPMSNFPAPSDRRKQPQQNSSDMSWLNLGGEERT